MRHAIVNLVNNAFKYSSGKKSPEVVLTKTDNSIIFEVVDYGIGIPKHDHRKLFSAFFRSSNVATIPGSGLGLMVVDYVVKKHNGTVSFTSSENQGSIFKITIPFN
jgi:signal transduction histidine kinase